LIAWVVLVIVRNAWLSDDSYISFRIVNNWVEGRGMTWNPGQRVQGFTHPAWFFILSAAHALTHEIYYTALALSVCVAGAGLWLAATRLAHDVWNALAVLLALSFSRAFVDYSTSGLENTLSHLLLFSGILGLVRVASPRALFAPWIDLSFALLVLNRVDLGLIVAPSWLWLMWRRKRAGAQPRQLLVQAVCVAAPLLVWWVFSIFYFGYALPNTAYAKLGVGVPLSERVAQGLFYVLSLVATDPASALLLVVGLICLSRGHEAWQRPMLLGVVFYLAYVISIGGDFMAGRFFTAPLAIAAVGVLRMQAERSTLLALAGVFAFAGWIAVTPPPFSAVAAEGRTSDAKLERRRYRVTDERRYYHADTGLLTADRVRSMPGGDGPVARDAAALAHTRGNVLPKLGMRTFLAGPDAYVIDPQALVDPFLARLSFPAKARKPDWTAGHFKRPIPNGYAESIRAEKNLLEQPQLAKFYDKMQLITTGPLWSRERLHAIWQLNTGQLAALSRTDGPTGDEPDAQEP